MQLCKSLIEITGASGSIMHLIGVSDENPNVTYMCLTDVSNLCDTNLSEIVAIMKSRCYSLSSQGINIKCLYIHINCQGWMQIPSRLMNHKTFPFQIGSLKAIDFPTSIDKKCNSFSWRVYWTFCRNCRGGIVSRTTATRWKLMVPLNPNRVSQ